MRPKAECFPAGGGRTEDADVQESGDAREKAQNPGQQENRILTEGEREESEEAKTGRNGFFGGAFAVSAGPGGYDPDRRRVYRNGNT